jgi:hypothetical protein
VDQVVEQMASKFEALSSNPSIDKKKQKEREREDRKKEEPEKEKEKSPQSPSVGENTEQLYLPYISGGSIKWHNHFETFTASIW